jgi:hypothetical protein
LKKALSSITLLNKKLIMTNESMNRNINRLGFIAIIAGLFGMLFCFRFLWSARMEDLVGAGFPFVAGAILFGSGIVTLAINNRR